MPAFLGGLPGAALAMYHCARPENRHKIKGLLVSGVIACVVGGTTEPLEFLFLFVRPGYFSYVIHALLTGLGFTIMAVLGVTSAAPAQGTSLTSWSSASCTVWQPSGIWYRWLPSGLRCITASSVSPLPALT